MQATVRKTVSFHGVGLHSGKKTSMCVYPARIDEGISFSRTDVTGARLFLGADSVQATTLATTIGNDSWQIATIEHFMAALYAAGITNATIGVSGPELPALDGSALPFYQSLLQHRVEQDAKRPALVVTEPFTVGNDSAGVTFLPAPELNIDCMIDFPDTPIGEQRLQLALKSPENWLKILPARTFGFKKDIEQLQSMGAALGGSLDNAILVDGPTILNNEGLRFPDEFVRHKMMDLVGDLALCQMELRCHIIARCSGHRINNQALRALLASKAVRLENCGAQTKTTTHACRHSTP